MSRKPAAGSALWALARLGAALVAGAPFAACTTAPVAAPEALSSGSPAARSVAGAQQLLVVRAAGWEAIAGELGRYQRDRSGSWEAVGRAVPVMLGKSGLGWGHGLHGGPPGEPAKREGDGRAPAGLFALGPAFGAAPTLPAGSALPYLRASATVECVDDVRSAHYNQLLDAGGLTARDWSSSESMNRADGLYDLGVFVQHNVGPATPGRGSCIFLHIWRGPGAATAGCTSMERPALEEVVRWLRPADRPLLVQLPALEYAGLRGGWGLP